MDDPFLMRVLDGVADGDEERDALVGRELLVIAVVGDLHSANELHHEIGPPVLCRAGVENFRDVRVIHHRERLPLLLEARDHFLRIHSHLDDLERYASAHRVFLVGHPHHPEAAFTDLLAQFVRADHFAGVLWLQPRKLSLDLGRKRRSFEKRVLAVIGEQFLHLAAQRGILPAGTVKEGGAFSRRRFLERLEEEVARVRSR
jgi:hypothetical protein